MAQRATIIISKARDFIPEDVYSIIRGAFIAAGGIFLTYLSEEISIYITGQDFGTWTPVVVGFWSVVVNTVKKYVGRSNYIK